MGFLEELRDYVAKGGVQGGGAPTGPGVTPSGVRVPQPRPFVAPPGAPPSNTVGRPGKPSGPAYAALSAAPGGGAGGMVPPLPGGAGPPVPGGEGIPGAGAPGAGSPVLPPGAATVGYEDPGGSGTIILSPEGKRAYADRLDKARRAFGPYPGAGNPALPPPPLVPGKMFFNPFTGQYGRA